MKKLCVSVLALSGLLGTVAVASAQDQPTPPPDVPPAAPSTDPNAPPPPGSATPAAPPPSGTAAPAAPPAAPAQPDQPPAPAPAPAPAPPPVAAAPPAAPAAQPAPAQAPPPPPAVSWSAGTPGADTTTPDAGGGKKAPKPLIWRGTTFTWNQAASSQALGIGADYQSDDYFFYGWDFTFAPNLYVYDAPKDKVTVFAELGWTTELTNSDTTTDEHETLFKDMQLGSRYSRTIWESGGKEAGEYVTSGNVSARFVLPTSEISATQGRYLVTALGLGAKQQIKILGKNAKGLNNITVGPSFTWSHLFARSYQPTNTENFRTRQNASGQSFESDVLGTKSLDLNRVTLGLSFGLPLVQDLSLQTQFRLVGRFKHDFETGGGSTPCEVTNVGGNSCVVADRTQDRTLYQPGTTFDIALSYPVFEVVDFTLGYNNDTSAIGEDGKRRGIFYSPDAQFYLDITANLDSIYSKITKRDKKPNASQWASAR